MSVRWLEQYSKECFLVDLSWLWVRYFNMKNQLSKSVSRTNHVLYIKLNKYSRLPWELSGYVGPSCTSFVAKQTGRIFLMKDLSAVFISINTMLGVKKYFCNHQYMKYLGFSLNFWRINEDHNDISRTHLLRYHDTYLT